MTTPASTTTAVDIIDLLSGAAASSDIASIRGHRPQAREQAQRSFSALFEPADPGTFPVADRYAVAAYVSGLHGFPAASAFYSDLLADEDAELSAPVAALVRATATSGPFGTYREEGLQGENTSGTAFDASEDRAGVFDTRLRAAFAHAHLLVFRPRESSGAALAALADAGWSDDDIVTLSQLVAFLSFQLRTAWGLRVLAGSDPARDESNGERR
ncbi:CMD domain protein [Microbacterium sp. P01]|uniref:CMD domain protein n=1 Tax=Microbacterium sp. P01 TaxID=3366261 RepID=UPI00366BAB63